MYLLDGFSRLATSCQVASDVHLHAMVSRHELDDRVPSLFLQCEEFLGATRIVTKGYEVKLEDLAQCGLDMRASFRSVRQIQSRGGKNRLQHVLED
eukprot:CAMPEP_0175891392 /NCGR_PEP_ID=MMETSP0107_2-20121207/48362_1 /TAXON_ID=195067 ORGANISM="Goniomonas pacifica, Strain CCMP1869" /NCGR_SAMPLE_ID=MMETSP0107_2 /ASSEMBLY_ACC=CAM_ASM_000203 /LENGTH=95 /DNA_ID=CAMNT_0017212271 /DNA_START=272 /DNA_END=559 /DNA_ORIENTATION=-